jgi:hypothetical protein
MGTATSQRPRGPDPSQDREVDQKTEIPFATVLSIWNSIYSLP